MSNESPSGSDPPPHRGRLQAQGRGTEESEPWAQDEPPSKDEVLDCLDQLWDKLSPAEQKDREPCYKDAGRFIRQAPATGVDAPYSKSFRNRRLRGGVRIDFEIQTGKACVD